MKSSSSCLALLSAALTLAAAPAFAATISFTGTATNTNAPPAPDASCAPLNLLNFGPSGTMGSSNFGAFTYTQRHCTVGGPGPYSGGVFSYFFEDGDSLTGTYSGLASVSGVPGVINNTINLVVTGGTGRFLNGSGTIIGVGLIDFRGALPVATLTLDGTLDLPEVPLPAASVLMLGGLGLFGCFARRRSALTPAAV